MDEIRLLHTSDLHLDWVFPGLDREKKVIRRKEMLNNLDLLVAQAIQRRVAGVLICGDLFCARYFTEATFDRVVKAFSVLKDAGIKVVILPGESDDPPQTSPLKLKRNAFPPNVHIFVGDTWSQCNEIEGVTIYGLQYSEKNRSWPVLETFVRGDAPGFHVGMVHGCLEGTCDEEDRVHPILKRDIASSGLHYLALGHHHNMSGQTIANVKCYYSGALSHLGFDTLLSRGALMVTLSSTGVGVEPVPIPDRPHKLVTRDVTGKSMRQAVDELKAMKDEELCLKVELTGTVNLDQLFSAKDLERAVRDDFFHVKVEDHRTVLGLEPEARTVKDVFVQRISDFMRGDSMWADAGAEAPGPAPDAAKGSSGTVRDAGCADSGEAHDGLGARPPSERVLLEALRYGLASLGGGVCVCG